MADSLTSWYSRFRQQNPRPPAAGAAKPFSPNTPPPAMPNQARATQGTGGVSAGGGQIRANDIASVPSAPWAPAPGGPTVGYPGAQAPTGGRFNVTPPASNPHTMQSVPHALAQTDPAQIAAQQAAQLQRLQSDPSYLAQAWSDYDRRVAQQKASGMEYGVLPPQVPRPGVTPNEPWGTMNRGLSGAPALQPARPGPGGPIAPGPGPQGGNTTPWVNPSPDPNANRPGYIFEPGDARQPGRWAPDPRVNGALQSGGAIPPPPNEPWRIGTGMPPVGAQPSPRTPPPDTYRHGIDPYVPPPPPPDDKLLHPHPPMPPQALPPQTTPAQFAAIAADQAERARQATPEFRAGVASEQSPVGSMGNVPPGQYAPGRIYNPATNRWEDPQ